MLWIEDTGEMMMMMMVTVVVVKNKTRWSGRYCATTRYVLVLQVCVTFKFKLTLVTEGEREREVREGVSKEARE